MIRLMATYPWVVPVTSMTLNLVSAVCYFVARKPFRGIYWLLALGITLSVTFLIPSER